MSYRRVHSNTDPHGNPFTGTSGSSSYSSHTAPAPGSYISSTGSGYSGSGYAGASGYPSSSGAPAHQRRTSVASGGGGGGGAPYSSSPLGSGYHPGNNTPGYPVPRQFSQRSHTSGPGTPRDERFPRNPYAVSEHGSQYSDSSTSRRRMRAQDLCPASPTHQYASAAEEGRPVTRAYTEPHTNHMGGAFSQPHTAYDASTAPWPVASSGASASDPAPMYPPQVDALLTLPTIDDGDNPCNSPVARHLWDQLPEEVRLSASVWRRLGAAGS